jgi:pSer/pThr/pTyr-binding forkhead associated (FHA) protein
MTTPGEVYAQLRVEYVLIPCGWKIGQVIHLSAPRLIIGRAPQSDVRIDHPEISRQHAEIVQEGERCWLADLESRNGTFVNGEKLARGQRHPLTNADRVQIGQLIVFQVEDPKATLAARHVLIYVGGLALDPRRRDVYVRDRRVEPRLPLLQYKLLELLIKEPGKIFSKEAIIHAVWSEVKDPEGVSDQALDTVVSRLRQSLERLDKQHEYIERVRGRGVRFVPREN